MRRYLENEQAHHLSAAQTPATIGDIEFPQALKDIGLKASMQIADAQICRLLRLANVLDVPSPVDRPASLLTQLAEQIRDSTTALEEVLHKLADSEPSE